MASEKIVPLVVIVRLTRAGSYAGCPSIMSVMFLQKREFQKRLSAEKTDFDVTLWEAHDER